MKRALPLIAALLFAALLTTLALPAVATPSPPADPANTHAPPGITARATSLILVTPDRAVFSIAFSADAFGAPATTKALQQKTDAADTALKNFKLNEAEIRKGVFLLVRKGGAVGGQRAFDQEEIFSATQNYEVVLRDLTRVLELSNALLQSGASFTLTMQNTELPKYKEQARLDALRKAREKAEGMAKALGVALGKIIAADETPVPWTAPTLNEWYAASEGVIEPEEMRRSEPDKIVVAASVEVRFEIK